MTSFAEKLKQYMKRKNITVYGLSQSSNLSVMDVYKITQGECLPENRELVEIIANALGMSPFDKKQLMESYEISLNGEANYYEKKCILDFLQRLVLRNQAAVPQNAKAGQTGEFAAESKEIIYGKQNVDKFIQILLEQETKEKETEIYLLCQPEYEYPYQILAVYGEKLNLKISQIICLQGSQDYKAKKYNLDCLLKIQPLIMSNSDYQVYYYYDKLESHFHNLNVFPYLVMIGEHILQLSENYQCAVHDCGREAGKFFRNIIHDYMKEVTPMFVMKPGVNDIINTYNKAINEKIRGVVPVKKHLIFSSMLGSVATPFDVSMDYFNVNGEMGKLSRTFLKRNKELENEMLHTTTEYKGFFKESWVREYMETGYLADPYYKYCNKIPLESRLKVIEQAVRQIQEGQIMHYMLKPDAIVMPDDLYISCFDNAQVSLLFRKNNHEWCFLVLYERNMTDAFFHFIDTLDQSSMIYETEETLWRLQEIVKEYKGTGSEKEDEER